VTEQEQLIAEQKKYYKTQNFLLTPVRMIESMVQTILLILVFIFIGLFFPLIVYFQPHTSGGLALSFVAPLLTLLTLFTTFYADYYFLFGSIPFLVTWVTLIAKFGNDWNHSGNRAYVLAGFLLSWFIFLAVGILQHWLLNRPTKERPTTVPQNGAEGFCAEMNQARLVERLTLRYQEIPEEYKRIMVELYGDNYLAWKEPW
jgi:hypothetical protein